MRERERERKRERERERDETKIEKKLLTCFPDLKNVKGLMMRRVVLKATSRHYFIINKNGAMTFRRMTLSTMALLRMTDSGSKKHTAQWLNDT